MNPEPKRRGRPPKNTASLMENSVSRKAPPAGKTVLAARSDGKSGTPKPAVSRSSAKPAASRAAASPYRGFFATLSSSGAEPQLSLVDRLGKPIEPDFRSFTGSNREFLRSFSEEKRRFDSFLSWGSLESDSTPGALPRPSDRLVSLAVSLNVLVSESLLPYTLQPGEYTLAFLLSNLGADTTDGAEPASNAGSRGRAQSRGSNTDTSSVTLQPVLVDKETGERIQPASTRLEPLTQNVIRDGQKLYQVPGLGLRGTGESFKTETLSRQNLEAWLSLAKSRFPGLEIIAEGWTTSSARPVHAMPSLLFSEIDAYGYLHVRPFISLDGYPPGFFEENDLVESVRVNGSDKTIRISEVIYPEDPARLFRAVLAAEKGGSSGVYEDSGHFVIEGEFAKTFLTTRLGSLLQNFVLLQSNVLEKYRLRIARPKLKISIGSGIDYFSGIAAVDFGDESLSFGSFMDQYRKQGYITLSDGTQAWPEQESIKRFDRLIGKVKGKGEELGLSIFDLAALSGARDVEAEGEGWDRMETFLRGFNGIAKRKTNLAIEKGELRSYQSYGVRWLEYLAENRFGAFLADEMGLGKTLQIITLIRNAYEKGMEGNCLIIVPRTLIYNWVSEFARFAPSVPVMVHYGADRNADNLNAAAGTVILSSYATLRNDIEDFLNTEYAYVILDEAQNAKNLETKTSSAIRLLKARHRIAMSGTPIENGLGDLYSLFRFINPAFFGTETEFSRDFLKPIQERNDDQALSDLKLRLYPFMLRREKKDVLTDLPPKTEQTALIELSAEHLARYREKAAELKARVTGAIGAQGLKKSSFIILQALSELRRFAGIPEAEGEYAGTSAKREYLLEMVKDIVAEGHKCLIFTNFLAGVELVSEDLANLGIGNLVMTGATVNRQLLVEQFQKDPSIGAFIMTLKTGGVGLNLTAADYVFLLDPWWNRAAEMQAIDRTHRIGQANPVFCYRMIAKGTIEERILELQDKKAGLAEALLSSDSEGVRNLSENDIEYLLG